MRIKKLKLTHFSRAQQSNANCIRPDTHKQLTHYIKTQAPQKFLVRGAGCSYNDGCFNTNELIIDTSRFNHLISFNTTTGIAVCQGNTPFKDLFLFDPDFVPPVIPGTLHATVGGGIAHDVHGKNNHLAGSFGHHLSWFDLQINTTSYRCSTDQNPELFYATIAGLGLTGIITQVAIQMKRASRFVAVEHQQHHSISELLNTMLTHGINYDYQVAWLDLANAYPKAILSLANHCDPLPGEAHQVHAIPKIPFGLIKRWNIKLFNRLYFSIKKTHEQMRLEQFNNPLDEIKNWNRLYGSKGFIQFQAVFAQEHAQHTIERVIQLIKTHDATPTLAVLKLFIRQGEGLLSFCKPGFTIAIDFIRDAKAIAAVKAMNQLIADQNGRIYLAKDQVLNAEQFKKMYEKADRFRQVIKDYNSPMQSDLAKRLEIIE